MPMLWIQRYKLRKLSLCLGRLPRLHQLLTGLEKLLLPCQFFYLRSSALMTSVQAPVW